MGPFHKLVGGGSPGTKSVPKTGAVFCTRFFAFGCHFLAHLATECATQRASCPPGPVQHFEKRLPSHAIRISSRRLSTQSFRGRPGSSIERPSSFCQCMNEPRMLATSSRTHRIDRKMNFANRAMPCTHPLLSISVCVAVPVLSTCPQLGVTFRCLRFRGTLFVPCFLHLARFFHISCALPFSY